jgi:hypothetical protein
MQRGAGGGAGARRRWELNMEWRTTIRLVRGAKGLLFVVLLCAVGAATGCQFQPSPGNAGGNDKGMTQAALSTVVPNEARVAAQAFADSYVIAQIQALDEIRKNTTRPDVARWALAQKVATATASFTNATTENPYVACVDLVILVSLKRQALEKHWVPNLLKDEGQGLLAVARRGEDSAWKLARHTLSATQVNDLRLIIDTWVTEHPDQYYVGWVRLTDVAVARSLTASSPQVKMPGNVFGLLFIDPLAGLDPVTLEATKYRTMAERLMYLLMRLPMVYSWQTEATFEALMDQGAPRDIVSAMTKYAAVTARFTDVVAGYPKVIDATMDKSIAKLSDIVTRERTAALEQAGKQVTEQREAVTATLDAQQGKLKDLIGNVRSAIADADRTIGAAKSATADTMKSADGTSANMIANVRNAVIVVIVVACVAPAVTILAYKLARRRLAA